MFQTRNHHKMTDEGSSCYLPIQSLENMNSNLQIFLAFPQSLNKYQIQYSKTVSNVLYAFLSRYQNQILVFCKTALYLIFQTYITEPSKEMSIGAGTMPSSMAEILTSPCLH